MSKGQSQIADEQRQLAPFLAVRDEVLWTAIAQLIVHGTSATFLELGSGDGRASIFVAKTLGIKCLGLEIDRDLIKKSRKDAETAGVGELCEFREEDIMQRHWSRTDETQPHWAAAFVHLIPEVTEEIEEDLLELDCPIVSITFSLSSVKPDTSGVGWSIYNQGTKTLPAGLDRAEFLFE
jgi:hypothetical protein